MEKVRAYVLFYVDKVRALHLTPFCLLSELLQTITTSQSASGNFDRYCEKGIWFTYLCFISYSSIWLEVDISHPTVVYQWVTSQDLGLKYHATFDDFTQR